MKMEKELFLASLESIWPLGSMPRKKIVSKLNAERKLRSAETLSSSTEIDNESSQNILHVRKPTGSGVSIEKINSCTPLKSVCFPLIPFPITAKDFVVGSRIILPDFDEQRTEASK